MSKHEEMIQRAMILSGIIQPVLSGEPPYVQGAVLADLMSLWVAGHHVPGDKVATVKYRQQFLNDWIRTVWQLVPASEKQIAEMDNG